MLVIGASGFVGRHVCVALKAAGIVTHKATSRRHVLENSGIDSRWEYLDLDHPTSYGPALSGCRSVIYLYHGLGSGDGYQQREAAAAVGLRDAALIAGIERLIYLGGVIPSGMSSRHLESRRLTGEILRGGPLTTLELRAAMIIGKGSASFNLVRDLAVRVPIVALPPWMDGGSYPIGIDDVAYALTRALFVPLTQSAWFELPGPEWITHRDLVMILAAFVGTRVAPRRWAWLTPKLSARLLAWVGREPQHVVSELIAGLPSDLTPQGPRFWDLIDERPHCSIKHAILNALSDETSRRQPSIATEERLTRRVERLPGLFE